ncbi:MAG: hypothetical protein K8963_07195 [Proteobacteria bacterium]|nr:hypothetical protein [Pseudomonadota bacterium]
MYQSRKSSALMQLTCPLLMIAAVVALQACSSKKLISIYDPTYVEQLQVEADADNLVLPPGLNLRTSDEFILPEKIDARMREYAQIFGIFADDGDFFFRNDGQGGYWLTVRASAEPLWLGLKEFFRVEGLEVDYENFAVGEMRTRWAENLARNQFPDAIFHHADRYLIQVLPASEKGWLNVHLRHQGVYRDLRTIADGPVSDQPPADEAGKKRSKKSSKKSSKKRSKKRDEVISSYLRTRQASWLPGASEPQHAIEMLTRLTVFLGAPARDKKRKQSRGITGVLGRIYLERSEFGDISLVVGDNQSRTYFYVERVLKALPQFDGVNGEEKPDRILFTVDNRENLDPSLPGSLYLYFLRSGEYIKLLLFDQQDNIINPILAEGVYRLIADGLRPKYIEVDLQGIDLIDTKSIGTGE